MDASRLFDVMTALFRFGLPLSLRCVRSLPGPVKSVYIGSLRLSSFFQNSSSRFLASESASGTEVKVLAYDSIILTVTPVK